MSGLGKLFADRMIRSKLFIIIGLILTLLAVNAAISVTNLIAIGNDLQRINQEDFPASRTAAELTVIQLERAIALERFLGLTADGDIEAAQVERGRLAELEHHEIELLKHLEALEEELIAHATDPDRIAFGQNLADRLYKLEASMKVFADHEADLFSYIDQGKTEQAHDLALAIRKELDAIDHELESILKEIEDATGQAVEKAYAIEQATLIQIAVISGVSLVLGAGLAFFMGGMIAKPLKRAVVTIEALAQGDTSVALKSDTKDEVGTLARVIEVFRQQTIERKALEEKQHEEEARQAARARAVQQLASDFRGEIGIILGGVSSASGQMMNTADGMTGVASQTSEKAATVAAASEQASANVQTVASAAEELSSSISEISDQVSRAQQVTQNAVEANRSSDSDAARLNEAAEKIGTVVQLISEIADQTNLLALNATIEAARAGEAGKGFAVVASEVKALAQETAKATEEITDHVEAMRDATKNAVENSRAIGTIIAEVDEIASAVAAAVEEQNAATREIAGNIEQAAAGTEQVNQNISGVSNAATQTGRAAKDVQHVANDLSDKADTLRVGVESFLKEIQSA